MNIWEQQPDETAAQYKGFQAYLTERTVEGAYRKYIKEKKPEKAGKSRKNKSESSGSFKQWSRLFRWEARAREYDDYIYEESRKATIAAKKKQIEEHSELYRKIAKSTLGVLLKKLDKPDAINIKLTELVECAKYFDSEFLSEKEREGLLELQKVMSR